MQIPGKTRRVRVCQVALYPVRKNQIYQRSIMKQILIQIGTKIAEKALEMAKPKIAKFAARRATKLRKEAEEKTDPSESMTGGA